VKEVRVRLRRATGIVFGVAAAVLAVTPIAHGAISRFEPGGTAEATYGISPTDVSADGRYVAFVVDSDGAIEDDANGALDLFVRDRETGSTDGIGRNDYGQLVGSYGGTISDDGRFVAFLAADGILAEDANGYADVFLRDRQTDTTVLLSRGLDGASNGQSSMPQISGNGRFIVYESQASNLVAGDDNDASDVFVYDTVAGTTRLASAGRTGGSARGFSSEPSISSDGRYVAFASNAWNLHPELDTFAIQVFVRDLVTNTVSVVSVDSSGAPGSYGASFGPSISADGTLVAFASLSSTLDPADGNGEADIFVHNREEGTTRLVSLPRGAATTGEQSNGRSDEPQLSGDGSVVSFRSDAANLVPDDVNETSDAFAVKLATGSIIRLSTAPDDSGGNDWTQRALLSGNAGLAIFSSNATNLVEDGRSGTFVVEPLAFGEPPTVVMPGDLTIEAMSPYGTPLAYEVSASDPEDGEVPVSCDPRQGGEYPLGPVEVTCTATDSDGLTGTGSFVVTFVDTTAPVMLLVPITAVPNGPEGTRLGWNTHPTDNADWYPDVVCAPESFSDFVFPIGDTTVTCTATDDSGNSSTGTFVVHVLSVAELLRQAQSYLVEIAVEPTLRKSLSAELETAARAAERGKDAATCSAIGEYQNHVRAQSGKKLSVETADDLLVNADAIRDIVPCS
jgi:HYR domain/WD40-like Beta Propeller Repeat